MGKEIKTERPSLGFQPFGKLGKLLKEKTPSGRPGTASPPKSEPPAPAEAPVDDRDVFLEAMEGVNPLAEEKYVKGKKALPRAGPDQSSGDEALERLHNLVKYGDGFVISDTPEYIEGTGYSVPPGIARRLHRGDFSIQADIDLHGMNAEEAQAAFEAFLRDSLDRGRKGVLVIHGRGLSSPAEPVLKTKVVTWLTTGPWRKWVVAYSSARSCDGGTGATYIMLRHRPVTKRFKKTP